MAHNMPDPGTVRAMIALAVRAPSVHNSQPWLWRVGERTVQLYVDPRWQLPNTDPDGRDMIISCGAALHHLRVAAAASGWRTAIHRLPDPANPDHLAAVEFRPTDPDEQTIRLAQAIGQRRSDRRRYTSWEVPSRFVAAMVEAGTGYGALVRAVEPGEEEVRLLRAFDIAARQHGDDDAYRIELAHWSGRHAAAYGVPAHSAVVSTGATVRPFSDPMAREAVTTDLEVAERMMLISTSADDRRSQLQAGEAASAILLAATSRGLATCPLSEPLEVPATRAAIRSDLLHDSGFPQLIIRVGYAATSAEALPETPRRPLDDVVSEL
ncbi:Acg family FMN-binding oxidoreductase [Nocardia stercoris]|uniref:NAD(P)H nitroreductase n=1 Tax=Nocardia stercoris TaxID=2483361 RepID=A0A3M2LC69_9NOCA|nr:nitroreductase family protein [Nocardia stercoris]RMI33565.1 NAD(P)H nitroreductase [Nocardia stercoris]